MSKAARTVFAVQLCQLVALSALTLDRIAARAGTRCPKVTRQRISAWQRGTNLPSSRAQVDSLVSVLIEHIDGHGNLSKVPAELRELAWWYRIWYAAGIPCVLDVCVPATRSLTGTDERRQYSRLRPGSLDRVCLADASRMRQNEALLDLLGEGATGDDRSLVGCLVAVRASLADVDSLVKVLRALRGYDPIAFSMLADRCGRRSVDNATTCIRLLAELRELESPKDARKEPRRVSCQSKLK